MKSHLQTYRSFFAFSLLLPMLAMAGCSAKAKVERHVKRADAFYEEGEREKARIEYMNAFRLDRNDAHVSARLGEFFLEDGEFGRAFQFYSHAKNLQPTNNDVRVKVASLLFVGGKPKEARTEVEEVLKVSPTHADALLLLVNSAATTNDVAAVRARLESLAATNQKDSAIFLGLGVLAVRSGDTNAAEARFKRAIEIEPKSRVNNLTIGNFYAGRGDTNKAEVHLKAAMDNAPVRSVERLSYAQFLTKTDRSEEAKKFLEESVAKEPDFIAGWNALTQIAFSRNDRDKAREYIKGAFARDPQNREALLNQARLRIAEGDFKTAALELEKLAQRFPRDAQTHYHLANAYLGDAEPARAIASLNQAISSNTNHVDAILMRARLQISQGDVNNATADLNRLIRQFPRLPQSYYLLASAYRSRGTMEDALAVYNAVTKLFPTDPQAHQMIAGIQVQQRKLADARKAYEAALAINADYLPAIDDLIDLDIHAKQYDAALARIQTYLRKYPDKPMPHLLHAKVLQAQSKIDDAEKSIKKAIELDPEFAPAHRTLAQFYIQTQQTDQAIAKLEAMIQKNAKDIGSLVQVGMLYEAKTNYSRAQEVYEAALTVNPRNVVALNNLAFILSEQTGDLERSYQYARRARDVSPYDGYTADTLGWITWKQGNYPQALSILQQSAERLPDHPEVQYHLGMAYYMTGSKELALAALTKATQSTNNFIGEAKAQTALEILKVDSTKPSAEGIARLQKAIIENPADIYASVQLALCYEAQSNWEMARDAYEKALQKNPNSTLLLSKFASLNIGPLKQPARALELARKAWGIDQDGDLAAVLGPIGYAAGDFKWAYGVLLNAERAQPENARTSFYMGLAAYAVGRIAHAEEAFTRAAQADSLSTRERDLAKAASRIAAFHAGKIALSEAKATVKSALGIDPQFPPAIVAAGLIAEQNADYPGARAQYEAALKMNPAMLVAQRQLALLLSDRLPDDAKAYELATAIRADFQNDPQLTKALGKIAYRRADYAEAVRLMRLASSELQDDSDLLYHLGMAQYHVKDKSAKSTLTRAVQLEPGARFAPEAKKAIAELK